MFPQRISTNHRYLTDQAGRPILLHGESPWSLITAITGQEAELYLTDRAAKGFNALIVNLVEHKFNGPPTRAGEQPFTNPRDLSTVNELYFEYARWVCQKAASYGMTVFLAPLFLGYKHARNDDGWYQELLYSGPGKLWDYGQLIGHCFAGLDNIVWLIGDDRNTLGIEQEINSLVMGIKESDPCHLFTAQPAPDEVTLDWYGGTGQGGWLDLNAVYGYAVIHKKLLAEYNRKPVMPFVLLESTYEGEHNASPVQIRRQAYWAILCGACGQFMGNNPVWLFNPGWKQALDQEASRNMVHVKALFESRPWYNLVPDQNHVVVTHELGEFNGMDYFLTAARATDGSTVIAYVPAPREVSVHMSAISGKYARAWWFDPRTGKTQDVGSYPTRGEAAFRTPGDGDWVLVLDDEARAYCAPGETDE